MPKQSGNLKTSAAAAFISGALNPDLEALADLYAAAALALYHSRSGLGITTSTKAI